MAELGSSIGAAATTIFSIVTTGASTVAETPLLLFSFCVGVVFSGVALFKKLRH